VPNEDKLDSEIVAEDSMESRLSSISKDSLSRLSHEDMNSDTKESNSEKLNPLSIGNGLKNSFKGILKAAIDKVHSDSDISSNLDIDHELDMDKAAEDSLLGETDESSHKTVVHVLDDSANDDQLLQKGVSADILLNNGLECEFSEADENSLLGEDTIENSSNFKHVKDSISNIIDSNILDDSQNSVTGFKSCVESPIPDSENQSDANNETLSAFNVQNEPQVSEKDNHSQEFRIKNKSIKPRLFVQLKSPHSSRICC